MLWRPNLQRKFQSLGWKQNHFATSLPNLLCFDCLILDCHGPGATHCYGDEDFMGQCKRLARKVHKNTLELRMIMRWLLPWASHIEYNQYFQNGEKINRKIKVAVLNTLKKSIKHPRVFSIKSKKSRKINKNNQVENQYFQIENQYFQWTKWRETGQLTEEKSTQKQLLSTASSFSMAVQGLAAALSKRHRQLQRGCLYPMSLEPPFRKEPMLSFHSQPPLPKEIAGSPFQAKVVSG